jgi:hypothetical protein
LPRERQCGDKALTLYFAMTSQPFGTDGTIARRFWLLGLAQAAHSTEEMTTKLYQFMWIATERLGLPRMGMTATTFAVVNMGIIAFLLGVAPFVAAWRPSAIAIAWVAAVIELLNGSGHLAGTVVFGGYVPGAVTAPLLIAAGVALLSALRRK